MEETVTLACIVDCSTITVHAGKCYKVLVNSGATISLLLYSTYKNIEDSYKTPIQPTTAKLNTTDGFPMTALGMTTLHLRIVEFKSTHNFVICDRLPDIEIIFSIDIQRSFYFHMLGTKGRIAIYKVMVNSSLTHETVNRRQQLAQLNHHLKYHHDTMVLYPANRRPTVNDILPMVIHVRYLTLIDASFECYNLQLNVKSSYLNTSLCQFSSYRYVKLSIKVSSTVDIFQRKINELLKDPKCIWHCK